MVMFEFLKIIAESLSLAASSWLIIAISYAQNTMHFSSNWHCLMSNKNIFLYAKIILKYIFLNKIFFEKDFFWKNLLFELYI